MTKKRGANFLITVLSIVICLGFFIGPKCQAADEVIINEIAWMGSADDSNNEWIELKNSTDSEIDLTDWTLEAQDGSPKIELFGIIPANGYFLLERTDDNSSPASADQIYSGALGNNGEILELKNSSENIIDRIEMPDGWTAGDNSSKQPAERCGNNWQTSSLVGGTPKTPNTCDSTNTIENNEENYSEEETKNYTSTEQNCSKPVINEFLSSPEEGETEWIELYCPESDTSISSWYVTDGSGGKTILSGKFSNNFFLIEKPKGALNNSGDEINLFSPEEELIDNVAYGDWGDDSDKNIPAPPKGSGAARIEDGVIKNSWQESFVITQEPTPGKANIIKEILSENSSEEVATAKISITEILPNPVGSDRENEFIELKNNSDKETDLTGWSVAVDDGRIFIFGKFFALTTSIPANGYFVLWRQESNLAMNNGGGKIRLFKPNSSRALQILEYGQAPEGAGFVDTETTASSSLETTKRFLQNSLNPSQWTWTYRPTPGSANEILTLNRPPEPTFFIDDNISTGSPIIFDASDSIDQDGDDLSFSWDFGDGIKISGETVSHTFLKNGKYEINLSVSDGQAKSIFKKIISLSPKNYLEEISQIQEEKTPASINKTPIQIDKNLAEILTQTDDKFPYAKIEEIKNKKAGENVSVSGVVIVSPNVFGTQYFYISIPLQGMGTKGREGDIIETPTTLKIYNFKKNFPQLKTGDFIKINGQVMQNAQEKYLKIASQEDVEISGVAEISEPIKVEDLKAEDLNKFLTIQGEIIKKDGSRIILETSSSTASVYFKAGANIDKTNLKSGVEVKISGLAGIISKEVELLPRSQNDIQIISGTQNQKSETKNIKNNNSSQASSSTWILPEKQNNNQVLIYSLISLTFVFVFLFKFIKNKLKNRKKS